MCRYFAVLKPMNLSDVDRRGKVMLTMAWVGSTICSIPQVQYIRIIITLVVIRNQHRSETILLYFCWLCWSYPSEDSADRNEESQDFDKIEKIILLENHRSKRIFLPETEPFKIIILRAGNLLSFYLRVFYCYYIHVNNSCVDHEFPRFFMCRTFCLILSIIIGCLRVWRNNRQNKIVKL